MINVSMMQYVGIARYFLTIANRQFHKRILHTPIRYKTPDGKKFKVAVNIPFTFEITASKWKMDWGAEIVLRKIQKELGESFVDIGGNIGYYSALMAPVSKKTIIFEPDDRYLDLLRENIAGYPNVVLETKGVFKESTTLTFARPLNKGASGGLQDYRSDHAAQIETFTLECVSLDDYFASGTDRVSTVKIDTDGSELEILQGMTALVASDAPVILTEFGHLRDPVASYASLVDWCVASEYVTYAFLKKPDGSGRPTLRAVPLAEVATCGFGMLFLVPSARRGLIEPFVGKEGYKLKY
jgi:FkbM family methyltransferase